MMFSQRITTLSIITFLSYSKDCLGSSLYQSKSSALKLAEELRNDEEFSRVLSTNCSNTSLFVQVEFMTDKRPEDKYWYINEYDGDDNFFNDERVWTEYGFRRKYSLYNKSKCLEDKMYFFKMVDNYPSLDVAGLSLGGYYKVKVNGITLRHIIGRYPFTSHETIICPLVHNTERKNLEIHIRKGENSGDTFLWKVSKWSWALNETYLVQDGATFSFMPDGEVYTQYICGIGKGLHELTITSTSSDGMNSDEWYQLLHGVNVLANGGGKFGREQVTKFGFCETDSDCNNNDECFIGTCDKLKNICEFETLHCTECIPDYACSFETRCIPSSCDECDKLSVEVTVKTDVHFTQTSWIIQKLNSTDVVAQKTSFNRNYYIFYDRACLSPGTYQFIMKDTEGNGLGGIGFSREPGYFYVTRNNSTLVQNKTHFRYEDISIFGICFNDNQCNDGNSCTIDSCDFVKNICNFEKMRCDECLPEYNCEQFDYCVPTDCRECGLIKIGVEMLSGKHYYSETYWNVVSFSTNEIALEFQAFSSAGLYKTTQCVPQDSYIFTYSDEEGKKDYLDRAGYVILYVNDIFIQYIGVADELEHIEPVICASDEICKVTFSPCHVCNRTSNQCIAKYSEECRSFGKQTAIAIRVKANDAETSTSLADISRHAFGIGKNFSMTSQFLACSYDQFEVAPFNGMTVTGQNISNGAFEVSLTTNTQGRQAGEVANDILLAANDILGDLESQFQFVLICLPPNTLIGVSTSWKAYAFVNSYLSVNNDRSCEYPSVMMHEIGHNLGLSHSNDEKNYGDESCLMGLSYNLTDGPNKCFNGPKSWQLGWYSNKHKIVDLHYNYRDVYFKSISEYHRIGTKSSLIAKLINSQDGLDYYITLNENIGITTDAKEGNNTYLVTKQSKSASYEDSVLVGRIAYIPGSTVSLGYREHLIFDVEEGANLHIVFTDSRVSFKKDSSYWCYYDFQCNDFNTCTFDYCNANVGYRGFCKYQKLDCSDCGALVTIELEVLHLFKDLPTWSIIDAFSDSAVKSGSFIDENHVYSNETMCMPHGKYIFSLNVNMNNTLLNNSLSFTLSIGDVVMDNGTINEESLIESIFVICSSTEDCNDYDGCSIDYCDMETKLCNNTYLEDACMNCTMTFVDMTFDNFPEESSWGVFDKNKEKPIISGQPYPFNLDIVFGRRKAPTRSSGRRKAPTRAGRRKAPTKAGRRKAPTRAASSNKNSELRLLRYSRKLDEEEDDYDYDFIYEEICLEVKYKYHFIISDSFGDGICCTEGNGYFILRTEKNLLLSGGNFTEKAELIFQYMNCTSSLDCDNSDLCVTSECNSELGICIFVDKPCHECGALVTVQITTNHYSTDISWFIVRGGEIVFRGGPYPTSRETFADTKCLKVGTYFYTIYDAGGGLHQENYLVRVSDKSVIESNPRVGPKLYVGANLTFGVCLQDADCDDNDDCTNEVCDLQTNSCVYSHYCNGCNKTLVSVYVNTDFRDSSWFNLHISWELYSYNLQKNVMTSFTYEDEYTTYEQHLCLPAGYYWFTIRDTSNAKVGLCKSALLYSENAYIYDDVKNYKCGSFNVTLNDQVQFEGESFYEYFSQGFAICDEDIDCDDEDICTVDTCDKYNRICKYEKLSCSVCSSDPCDTYQSCIPMPCEFCKKSTIVVDTFTDLYAEQNWWQISDLETQKVLYYSNWHFNAYTHYQQSLCLGEGSYDFVMVDEDRDGMRDCLGTEQFCANYTVSIDNELVIYGNGDFISQDTTSFEIKEKRIPSADLENGWILDFDSSNISKSLEEISLQYKLRSGKLEEQFNVGIFKSKCKVPFGDESFKVKSKEIIEVDEIYSKGIVKVQLNRSNFEERSAWELDETGSRIIRFCAKAELFFSDVSVSFAETELMLKFNMLASSLEVSNVALGEAISSSVSKDSSFQLDACICNHRSAASITCDENQAYDQSSEIHICVSSLNSMKIKKFENVILYQDDIPKLYAVDDGEMNKITKASTGEIAVLQTRLVSSFFEDLHPSPVVVRGTVLMGFEGRRLVNGIQFPEKANFELYIDVDVPRNINWILILAQILLTFGCTGSIIFLFIKRSDHNYQQISTTESECAMK